MVSYFGFPQYLSIAKLRLSFARMFCAAAALVRAKVILLKIV